MTELALGLARELARHVENAVVFDAIDSTHAVAIRLIDQVDSEGLTLRPTVICANRQGRGVGRGSRRWLSPPGGLYLNWVSSAVDPSRLGEVPMLAAAAALAASVEAGARTAAIKWPNDILVGGRKLAGILVHARRGDTTCLTVGFGFNVDPITEVVEDAVHQPISLAELVGADEAHARAAAVAVGFVAGLTASLADPGPALELWRRRLIHREGDRMAVRLAAGTTASGTYAGLTKEGYLRLVDSSGQERTVTGGDVIESPES